MADDNPTTDPMPGRPVRRRGLRRTKTVAVVVAVCVVLAAAMYAGIVIHSNIEAKQSGKADVQRDMAYVAKVAAGVPIYVPKAWEHDPMAYPQASTVTPKNGLWSSQYLDKRWVVVQQFDTDAPDVAENGATPSTLCELTDPDGITTSRPGDPVPGIRPVPNVRSTMICTALAKHHARLKVVFDPDDEDDSWLIEVASDLPEPDRTFTASMLRSKKELGWDDPRNDAVTWARELLDGLVEYDPSQFSVDDLYDARKKAGYYQ